MERVNLQIWRDTIRQKNKGGKNGYLTLPPPPPPPVCSRYVSLYKQMLDIHTLHLSTQTPQWAHNCQSGGCINSFTVSNSPRLEYDDDGLKIRLVFVLVRNIGF